MHNLLPFLQTHVNGKTLHTAELTYSLEDGALRGVYSDQILLSSESEKLWI